MQLIGLDWIDELIGYAYHFHQFDYLLDRIQLLEVRRAQLRCVEKGQLLKRPFVQL